MNVVVFGPAASGKSTLAGSLALMKLCRHGDPFAPHFSSDDVENKNGKKTTNNKCNCEKSRDYKAFIDTNFDERVSDHSIVVSQARIKISRKFNINLINTPGSIKFRKSMIAGVGLAYWSVGILTLDGRDGVFEQQKEEILDQLNISYSMGVKKLIVCVNRVIYEQKTNGTNNNNNNNDKNASKEKIKIIPNDKTQEVTYSPNAQKPQKNITVNNKSTEKETKKETFNSNSEQNNNDHNLELTCWEPNGLRRYSFIASEMQTILKRAGFDPVQTPVIPYAIDGTNIVEGQYGMENRSVVAVVEEDYNDYDFPPNKSNSFPWYDGPTVVDALRGTLLSGVLRPSEQEDLHTPYLSSQYSSRLIELSSKNPTPIPYPEPYKRISFFDPKGMLKGKPLRFAVQSSHLIEGVGTVIIGQVKSGTISPGDPLYVAQTKQICFPFSLEKFHKNIKRAVPGDIIGINIKDGGFTKEDFRRGYILGEPGPHQPSCVLRFTAQIIVLWNPFGGIKQGYTPVVHAHSSQSSCSFKQLISKIDRRTHKIKEEKPDNLQKGDCAMVVLQPSNGPHFALPKVVVEAFSEFPPLGRFVMIDQGRLVAVGIVKTVEKAE